jgi:uncharacterized membrane protein YgdD (TMEM256/DUF423 family)
MQEKSKLKFLTDDAVRVAFATIAVLCVPLIAMQFSDDVSWTPMDFAIAGTLLFTGLSYVLTARKIRSKKQRLMIGGTLAAILSLVWLELAVGVFTKWGS